MFVMSFCFEFIDDLSNIIININTMLTLNMNYLIIWNVLYFIFNSFLIDKTYIDSQAKIVMKYRSFGPGVERKAGRQRAGRSDPA